MMKNSLHGYLTIGILTFLLLASSFLYVYSPILERSDRVVTASVSETEKMVQAPYPYTDNHVVVFLDTMTLELRKGSSTIETIKVVSVGKPGSYYETIGGVYENDYKIRNHFSSIGKVYLPYSVHLFGNFFVHGIPYYPDGEKVSSEYSGGCIRLSDDDAKRLYEFVTVGTPIIVVKQDVSEFSVTANTTDVFNSMEATRYMATLVSLEVLKQDEKILDTDGDATTRRKLIPRLLNEKDDTVIHDISRAVGNDIFLEYMNKKAVSLGLSNTKFTLIDGPAVTSADDYARLVRYVSDYKSYLVTVASTTPLLSQ